VQQSRLVSAGFCDSIWFVHTVDDGTGVISCSCWKTPYGDPGLDNLRLLSGKFMQSVLSQSFASRSRHFFFVFCWYSLHLSCIALKILQVSGAVYWTLA